MALMGKRDERILAMRADPEQAARRLEELRSLARPRASRRVRSELSGAVFVAMGLVPAACAPFSESLAHAMNVLPNPQAPWMFTAMSAIFFILGALMLRSDLVQRRLMQRGALAPGRVLAMRDVRNKNGKTGFTRFTIAYTVRGEEHRVDVSRHVEDVARGTESTTSSSSPTTRRARSGPRSTRHEPPPAQEGVPSWIRTRRERSVSGERSWCVSVAPLTLRVDGARGPQ